MFTLDYGFEIESPVQPEKLYIKCLKKAPVTQSLLPSQERYAVYSEGNLSWRVVQEVIYCLASVLYHFVTFTMGIDI